LFFDPVDSGLLANVLYGALLIGAMFVMPGGIVSFVRSVRSRLVRFTPRAPATSPLRGEQLTEAKGTA
jgi:hypothetical protein